MVRADKAEWKAKYFMKLQSFFAKYPKVILVTVDHVGSKQMQEIRIALRGKGEVLMGKNTMIRKCLRGMLDERPELEKLMDQVYGNIGFVFTEKDLKAVKDTVTKFRVKAPAKSGTFAPIDVFVEAGPTTMGPEKTNFFQALNIPTKINKGTIEILSRIHLVKEGERVGASEAALLNMMNVSPFQYGLVPKLVFDEGALYSPKVLDMTEDDIKARFMQGVRNVAAVSLAINYPTAASVPHSIVNGLKKLIAVAVMTDITFPAAEKTKAYLKDPSAFAVAAAPAAAAAAPAAAAAKAPEPEPESDEDMGMSLFD
eukprot:m.40792 g.40792  ORF g.40792 m.40792 type:complete len:313 (+) comp14156_c0_seq1:600-1538(+)